jgi:hypothetical protein
MNQMGQKIAAMIALGTLALVIGLGELRQAQAQEAKEPYPDHRYEPFLFLSTAY